MGKEYRRNIKNLYGRPDIVGRDVWEVGGSLGQAPGPAAALTDRQGATQYNAGSDARLEGAMAQVTGVMTLGRIGLEILLDGTVVASGNLYAGGPTGKYLVLPKESCLDVPIASGNVVTANASVEQSLGEGQAVRLALSLALLENPERA